MIPGSSPAIAGNDSNARPRLPQLSAKLLPKPALARINFAALLSETLALFLPPATPSWLATSAVRLLRFASRVLLRRLHSCEETAELKGIARETGIGMDLLVAFNVALDLLMGCTSGGVHVRSASSSSSGGETAGGSSRMVHFRTLDWDMDELRQLVVELEFVRAEGGPVVARTVGYFGYVGVLTGVREGLSVSLNFRAGQELERRKLWALRWHLAMVVLGRRRGVASVLRGYLLGEGRVRMKGRGWLIRGEEGKGEVEAPPNIDDILADLARSPSTAAYLIFCTPSRAYSVEKGYRTASVQSSSEFLTTCNHDVADEPDPSRIHAAAQHVASQGMAEIIDESFERKQVVEHVWRQRLRLRRKTRRHRGDAVEAVTEEDVLHMLGHEDITYGGTHYAVVMDPGSGGFLWRRVYQTDDLRGDAEPVAAEAPQLPGDVPLEEVGRRQVINVVKTGRLPRDQVAVTIAGAVAAVANAVANAPAGTRLAIAAAYQTTAKHATDVVRKAVRGTSQGAMLLEQLERYDESLRRTGGASSPRPCCAAAVLGHETDLRARAALCALRAYTANMEHIQAARALDAVVAGPRLSSAGSHSWRRARCTCACTGEGGGKGEGEGRNPAGCEDVLRADKQLTALYAVWSLNETTAPESEAAKALAAAVAGAVGGTSAPPLERSSAGEIRGCRDTLLQVVREMDEELTRAEAATAGSDEVHGHNRLACMWLPLIHRCVGASAQASVPALRPSPRFPCLPPNPTHPTRDYTIPALLLPPSTYLMDSKTIAAHLEALHPSPPLHLASPALARLEALMPRVLRPLQPVYIPRVPRRVLGEGSIPYFLRTRERDLGMTLGQYEAARPWEGCWDAAAGAIVEVTGLLEEGGAGGPFFMGAEVSYADFVWGGFLLFCKKLGEEVWAEVLVRSGNADAHRALLKGLEKWAARDGE
ncbi:hypothetical protein NEMBOFW57_008033 [Staphylotrichum longicolle]|uniref:ceramidase n=1 Tax=Staphylotrichum longicolle TaxID=669026 RepID=A0AAD4HTW1_9PEZI|nr:hypothetical protein NEMBOFW57_008033 [Staphylotrichum longicolle]